MKKIIITSAILLFSYISGQYKVKFDVPQYMLDSDAYLYGFNGSKELLLAKGKATKSSIEFSVDKPYRGMMRVYFQKTNSYINLASENIDSHAQLFLDDKNKISNVKFIDEVNLMMSNKLDLEKKRELILPALIQIKEFYKPNDTFFKSLDTEIISLSKDENLDSNKYPFLSFYNKSQMFDNKEKLSEIQAQQFVDFFTNSNQYLETSSLMKPTLLNYLNLTKGNVEVGVDNLLEAVNLESPRGQTVLSELIEIFTTYNMDKLKDKYLAQATSLKCTINDRLSSTINANKNTAIGAKFPNSNFKNAINTKAKSLYDIKADKKIIVFYSSTCSHCEEELPKLLGKYESLKSKNIQVVAFSLDSNLVDYKKKAEMFPWVSDSEGRGWYSSYSENYNIVATPTYFVLDSNNQIISKPNHVGDVLEYLKIQ